MIVKHCGHILTTPQERALKALPEEESLGISSVNAREYWCPDPGCRKRLLYKQDIYPTHNAEWARVRAHERKSFISRLRRAKASNAVRSQRMWEGKATTGMIWRQVQ